jgi:hypothetical protein
MYGIRVKTLNLSKSFILFENENLSLSEAKAKLKYYQNKMKEMINKGITPVIQDDNGNSCKIDKLSIVSKGYELNIKFDNDNKAISINNNA